VERSPIFSRLRPRFETQYGREQMSITARERACVRCRRRCQSLAEAGKGRKKEGAHLVQGREAGAVALDAADLAQGLLERRAEGYGAIL
jgi:hypothetical protein